MTCTASKLNDNQCTLTIKNNINNISKKVCHIVVIDNIVLGSSTNYIIKNYPYMLDRYYKQTHTDLQKVYIVYSYPKYDSIVADKKSLYSSFKKILYSTKLLICDGDHYFKLFTKCNDLMESMNSTTDKDLSIEIVFFTEILRLLSNECLELLENIMNNNKVTIHAMITNKPWTNNLPDKILKYFNEETDYNGKGSGIQLFIEEKLELLFNDVIKNDNETKINLIVNNGVIVGLNKDTIELDTYKYNSLLIHSLNNSLEVSINGVLTNVAISENINYHQLLDAVDTTIGLMINHLEDNKEGYNDAISTLYEQLKEIIFTLINDRSIKTMDTEIMGKSLYLYNKLKKNVAIIKDKIINNLNNKYSDNLFLEYAKRSQNYIQWEICSSY